MYKIILSLVLLSSSTAVSQRMMPFSFWKSEGKPAVVQQKDEAPEVTLSHDEVAPTGFRIVSVFPNPVHGWKNGNASISVHFELNTEREIEWMFLSPSGEQIMLLSKRTYSAGTHSLEFQPHLPLPTGTYFISARVGATLLTRRLIYLK